jgi:hypothetical protein
MRTLVDLLHTEHGYARIFYDQDSYSYELHSFRHPPVTDLFARMPGYASLADAAEAARDTLAAIHALPRGRINKTRSRGRRTQSPAATQLLLPVGTS